MAKPTDYDKTHRRNMAAIGTRIDRIFKKAAEEAAKIGVSIKDLPEDRIFTFDDYPATQKQIERLMTALKDSMELTIADGVRREWKLSNAKNDAMVTDLFGERVDKMSEKQKNRYFTNNENALEAFLQRKTQGLNLSERVWKYTDEFKAEIELGLDCGIRSGRDAGQLSRDLRDYLKNPDKLFRRVRDKHGLLKLSKRAKAYHPGQGVYRSSYKNARRLAATETNIAYRTSDHLRWQQMDFVVGIEIRLSNNHTILLQPGERTDDKSQQRADGSPKANAVRPLTDICDTLQGRYPKDFKFTGWHPHCRCHAITILKTDEEMAKDTERILNGQQPTTDSVNTVRDLPDAFKQWVEQNTTRIENARNLPYFIQDNVGVVEQAMGKPGVLTTITVGGTKYRVSKLIEECQIIPTSQGKVYLHPKHGKPEKAENLDFARWRAEQFGEEVILLPNPSSKKSADSYNITRRVQEEYKRSKESNSTSAMDRLLRDGSKQADYLIIEPMLMPMGNLEDALKDRVRRCKDLKEIRIKIGDCEALYTREQIISNGYKIQPEDFRSASISRRWGSNPKGIEPGHNDMVDAKVMEFFRLHKKSVKKIAEERHAKRNAAAIQQAWNTKRIKDIEQAVQNGLLPKQVLQGIRDLKKQEQLNARIAFLQKQAAAHAARTPEEIQAIKDTWEKRVKEHERIKRSADRVLALAKTWNEVDYSALEALIAQGKLTGMEAETRKVMDAVKAMRAEEKALSDLIPDVHGWHKQFSLSELQGVKVNVERTFKKKGWTFDINDPNSLNTLEKGLRHEVDYMGTKGRIHKTWEVAQSAYAEKLKWTEKRIAMLSEKTAIENDIKTIWASRSAVGKQLVGDFNALFANDTTDISILRAKAADIKAKADQLEKARLKREAKNAASASTTSIPFGGMTDKEAKEAFLNFAKRKCGLHFDPNDVTVDRGFVHLNKRQHKRLYEELGIETKAEHDQLWNHTQLGGGHGGRGGYVHTGNSFHINRIFRETGITGNIDTKTKSRLLFEGMTTDDLRTTLLLDKKIQEFSMPFPMLATRYVDTPALSHIFGQTVTGTSSWHRDDATLKSWVQGISKLTSKKMSVDPAFLSASTNEAVNVFFDQYLVKLQIELPPGTPMYLTNNFEESEIVLGRGTQLEFIKVDITKMYDDYTGNHIKHVTIRCRVKR